MSKSNVYSFKYSNKYGSKLLRYGDLAYEVVGLYYILC